MVLSIRDLSKTYHGKAGQVAALSNVNVEIKETEFVAVQGPSGCGKSTLLLAAGGLLTPDSGTVTIDNTDPYNLAAEQRAKFRADHVGFVFQQFHLVPYLNVLENVLAAAIPTSTDDAAARANDLLARFNLTDRTQHTPAELSVGERQRTALAERS